MNRADLLYGAAGFAAIVGLALCGIVYIRTFVGLEPPPRLWMGVLLGGATALGVVTSLAGWNLKRHAEGADWWREANAVCPGWLGWLSVTAFVYWTANFVLVTFAPIPQMEAAARFGLEARIGSATLLTAYALLFALLFLLRIASRQARSRYQLTHGAT